MPQFPTKRFTLQIIVITMLLLLACASATAAPTSTPAPDVVATKVSAMYTVIAIDATPTIPMSAEGSEELPAVTELPVVSDFSPNVEQTFGGGTLPANLYYLASDVDAVSQIFQLNNDGVSLAQFTFEQNGVLSFDISIVDGSIAYRTPDTLKILSPGIDTPQILVEGLGSAASLVWAPDGVTLAFGGNDLMFYSFLSNAQETIIPGDGGTTYNPISFSLDATKLLLQKISASGTADIFVYDLTTLQLTSTNGCFGRNASWNGFDSIFCYGSILDGTSEPGLSQFNLVDGSVEDIVPAATCPPCQPVAEPHYVNGDLHFFSAELNEVSETYPPLSLVAFLPNDDFTMVALHNDTFNVLNALWARDDASVLVLLSDGFNPNPTSLVLVPLDLLSPVTTIMPDASGIIPNSLRWGP